MHDITLAADRSRKLPRIESVGIVGAGVMGTAIAAANLQEGVAVAITDRDPQILEKADVELRRVTPRDTSCRELPGCLATGQLLTIREPSKRLPDCDLVIETVSEEIETKRHVLQEAEAYVQEQTILASNTSAISISALARGLERPQLFCGIHFLAPAQQTELIEIIPGVETGQATIAAAVAYAHRIGKSSIVVSDSPGFLINRLLFPYLNEALLLLSEGAGVGDIDRAARMFGMTAGPFEMLDLIGLDTALQAGRSLWQAYSDRLEPSPILPAMVKAGLLGQKVHMGFYRHLTTASALQENSGAKALLEFYVKCRREIKPAEVVKRLFLPMLLEATRILEEEVVDQAATIDLALTRGFGLSRNRDGLLKWADRVGAGRICAWLEPFTSLGPRMTPTATLIEMARSSKKFY